MRTLAAVARAAAVALVTAVLLAPPVEAHGIGGREDLPLPAWLFSYGAGAVVVVVVAPVPPAHAVARTTAAPKRPRLQDVVIGFSLPGDGGCARLCSGHPWKRRAPA